MEFNREVEQLAKFKKARVGIIEKLGMTYNLQKVFNQEGYFNIKVTPLGANICLLEDDSEGALETLVKEEKVWLGQWFKEIRRWRPNDVDNERVTWLRCYGIPCHAWCLEFFQFLTSPVGMSRSLDDDT